MRKRVAILAALASGARIQRALRAHRLGTAKVRIAVADAAGNQTIAGRVVQLTG